MTSGGQVCWKCNPGAAPEWWTKRQAGVHPGGSGAAKKAESDGIVSPANLDDSHKTDLVLYRPFVCSCP